MRVTEGAMIANFLKALQRVRGQSDEALRQLADGKKVRFGSDDAIAASIALQVRARMVAIDGYTQAGQAVRTDLETIDSALSEAVDLMTRARALAVRGGSDVTDRAEIATEIDALRERLLAVANTRQGGRYLFAGTATLTRPFEADGVYQGNGDTSSPEIDEGQTVEATFDGSAAFEGAGNVFDTLQALSAALRADDGTAVQGIAKDLDAQLDDVNAVRSELGTRMNAVDAALDRLSDRRWTLETRIAELEDIDIEEVAIRLASAETNGDALSAAAARVLGRSLFDFLA